MFQDSGRSKRQKTTAAPFQSSLARNAAVKEESEDLLRKKIKDEDVEQLLEKLSTEEYAKLAKYVTGRGMKFDGKAPKDALGSWHGRYTTAEDIDYYFEYEDRNPGIIATLVMPSYFNRRFTGKTTRTKSEAENSACRVFLEDADVLDAAAKLPPPMESIRKFTSLSAEQKKILREKGLDPLDIHRQLQQCVYMGFRELGCRNDRWDEAS